MALCERFHCLPWDLERHDLSALLRAVALLDTYRLGLKHKSGDKLTAAEDEQVGQFLMADLEAHG